MISSGCCASGRLLGSSSYPEGMVERFDTGISINKFQRTPSGGLELKARLTRTGVLQYRRADGSILRELRHPDDVFHAASLATLRGATITLDHPGQMVTPATYKEVNVGHVADDVARDGIFVSATTRVNDGCAIAKIETDSPDALRELSCGYTCQLVEESGEYNGEQYDMRQRDIRYNHVGIGPRGWGRAGSDVALRLDSAASVVDTADYVDGMSEKEVKTVVKTEEERAHAPPITLTVNHNDAAEIERLKAKLDVQESELVKLRKDASDDTIDAKAMARAELFETARAILGSDAKLTGRATVDVKKDVVAKLDSTLSLAGKPEAYVDAAFDLLVAKHAKERVDSVRSVVNDGGGQEDELDAAKRANEERSINAWKPKAVTS